METSLQEFEERLDRDNRTLNYLTQLFLAKRGLSLSRFRILRYLQSRSEVNMRQLQSQLLLCGSTLTELVDALVRKGLVIRSRDQGDRRMVFLRLTDEGRAVYREVHAYRCERLEQAMRDKRSWSGGINAVLQAVYAGLKEQITTPEETSGSRSENENCD